MPAVPAAVAACYRCPAMANTKTAWSAMLPGGLRPVAVLPGGAAEREAAHAFLTEAVQGPKGIGECLRVVPLPPVLRHRVRRREQVPAAHPVLEGAREALHARPGVRRRRVRPELDPHGLPVRAKGETALDYFEEFLEGDRRRAAVQRFIDDARRSRLGLHQDVMRTKKVAKFRELFTGKVTEAFPSIEEYGKGEILLTRMMAYEDHVFVWGDPKGFPKEKKNADRGHGARQDDIYLDAEDDAGGPVREVHEARRTLLDVLRHPERGPSRSSLPTTT